MEKRNWKKLFLFLIASVAIFSPETCMSMHRRNYTKFRKGHLGGKRRGTWKTQQNRKHKRATKACKARKANRLEKRFRTSLPNPPKKVTWKKHLQKIKAKRKHRNHKKHKKARPISISRILLAGIFIGSFVVICRLFPTPPGANAYSYYNCKITRPGVLSVTEVCEIREKVYCREKDGVPFSRNPICASTMAEQRSGATCDVEFRCKRGSSPTYTTDGLRILRSEGCRKRCANANITINFNETFTPDCSREPRQPRISDAEFRFPGEGPNCCYGLKAACLDLEGQCLIHEVYTANEMAHVHVSIREGACYEYPACRHYFERRTENDDSPLYCDYETQLCFGWDHEDQPEIEDFSFQTRMIGAVGVLAAGIPCTAVVLLLLYKRHQKAKRQSQSDF